MSLAIALVLLGAAASTSDRSPPAAALSLTEVQQRWSDGRLLQVQQPRALRDGLLRTGFLEELNRAQWAPRDPRGRFDPNAVRQLWVGPTYVMAFDTQQRLRFAYFRYSVPVDASKDPQGAWSPQRLHRRRTRIDALKSKLTLRATQKDRHGNVFVWSGRAQRMQARLRYLPERDELRLILRY